VQPYIEEGLARRLRDLCAARGFTETHVVQEALRLYLDGTADGTLVLRRLDRLGREVQRTQRDLDIFAEAFGIWVRVWFAHTPALADETKRAARAAADVRYR
jgi:hypothetical protein